MEKISEAGPARCRSEAEPHLAEFRADDARFREDSHKHSTAGRPRLSDGNRSKGEVIDRFEFWLDEIVVHGRK